VIGLTILDQRRNDLGLGPLALRVMRLRELVPAGFVHRRDGDNVVFENGLVEQDQELQVSQKVLPPSHEDQVNPPS
jgi:hypothetical protein